jgi:hypothetical protein
MIKDIANCKHIYGIVIIDGVSVKFSFSPTFMDGNVFTDNPAHRLIVKTLIPVYVYNNREKLKENYN